MIIGTIELNSKNEKVFLPKLTCDFFIGILKPNKETVDKDSYKIEKDIDSKENDIVYAELDYYKKTCSILEVKRE